MGGQLERVPAGAFFVPFHGAWSRSLPRRPRSAHRQAARTRGAGLAEVEGVLVAHEQLVQKISCDNVSSGHPPWPAARRRCWPRTKPISPMAASSNTATIVTLVTYYHPVLLAFPQHHSIRAACRRSASQSSKRIFLMVVRVRSSSRAGTIARTRIRAWPVSTGTGPTN